MALKLSAGLGTTPEFWMNLQIANDLWELQNSEIELPKKIKDRTYKGPFSEYPKINFSRQKL